MGLARDFGVGMMALSLASCDRRCNRNHGVPKEDCAVIVWTIRRAGQGRWTSAWSDGPYFDIWILFQSVYDHGKNM